MEFLKILLILSIIFLCAAFTLSITSGEIPMDPRDREEDDRGQIEYLRQYREEKEKKEKIKVLENYEKNFDEEKFVKDFMEAKGITTKSKAIAELRKLIKKESYYQDKIKKTLQKKYPGDFVRKITQGAYSEAGIPDILFIRDGHYFGFEVKRPVVGVPSKIQLKTIEKIREAGGTAAIVVWPEQAIEEVENYEKGKR